MSRTYKDRGWRPRPEYWSNRPHGFKGDKKLTHKAERQRLKVNVGTIGCLDYRISYIAHFVSDSVGYGEI